VFAPTPEEALNVLPGVLRNGDVLLVQGAGSVNQISNQLIASGSGGEHVA
jgi:UDP-N-acetylmuramate-alanine ligase